MKIKKILFLLSGFVAVIFLGHLFTSTYKITILNNTVAEVQDFKLTVLPTLDHYQLGSIKPNHSKSTYLIILGDGQVRYDAVAQGRKVSGIVIGYVSADMGSRCLFYLTNAGKNLRPFC